jgi:hypothetical protein
VMKSRRFNGSNCIDARQPDPTRKLSHSRGCVRWAWELFHNPPTCLSPVRVRIGRGGMSALSPFYPQLRTLVGAAGTAASCQKRP